MCLSLYVILLVHTRDSHEKLKWDQVTALVKLSHVLKHYLYLMQKTHFPLMSDTLTALLSELPNTVIFFTLNTHSVTALLREAVTDRMVWGRFYKLMLFTRKETA